MLVVMFAAFFRLDVLFGQPELLTNRGHSLSHQDKDGQMVCGCEADVTSVIAEND